MAENKEHRTIGLTPVREYPTYQAVYQLHPQGEIEAEGLFGKAILTVVDWLRKRIEKKGNDASFLSAFPKPEDWTAFDPENAPDLTKNESYDIASIYRAADKAWAFRLSEPSTTTANQSFTTDVGIRKLEDSVLLGIRTVCREEPQSTYANVYRLDFVCNVLMQDPDIRVTECGVGQVLKPSFITLNGKSGEQCRLLKEKLLENKARRLPALLFYETAKARLSEEQSELVQKIVKAHCYLYCVCDTPYKLLISTMDRKDLAESFKAGDECIVIDDPANIAGIRSVRITDEEGNLDENSLVRLCESIQNRFRGRVYDYSSINFYPELREKRLLDTLPAVSDPKESEEIAAMIAELKENVEINKQTAAQAFEDNERLGKTVRELEKKLRLAHHENKTEQLELSLSTANARIEEQKAALAERDETIKALKNKALELRAEVRPFAALPLPATVSRDDILAWIRDNYGDRVIVHKRAADAFREYNKSIDCMALCRMIHYLYGFTVSAAENQGDLNATAEAAKAYDILGENFSAEPSAKKATMESRSAEFSIDISEFDPAAGTVLLDRHIKKGKGADFEAIRIYFYYDGVIKKSIIGYMPGHLDIGIK